MADKIDLEIVTPKGRALSVQVDEVTAPSVQGEFGVLPGHTPMLASLGVGELWYRKGQDKTYLAISFGFAEVLPDRVTILARIAERGEEIDAERAERARKRAEERLAHPTPDLDIERARIQMIKSLARLQVVGRLPVSARLGELKRVRA